MNHTQEIPVSYTHLDVYKRQIYKQALPYVDELIISRIPGKHEGETYFPSFNEYNFQLEKETQMETCLLYTSKSKYYLLKMNII